MSEAGGDKKIGVDNGEENNDLSRRQFLKWLKAFGLAAMGAGGYALAEHGPDLIDLPKAEQTPTEKEILNKSEANGDDSIRGNVRLNAVPEVPDNAKYDNTTELIATSLLKGLISFKEHDIEGKVTPEINDAVWQLTISYRGMVEALLAGIKDPNELKINPDDLTNLQPKDGS